MPTEEQIDDEERAMTGNVTGPTDEERERRRYLEPDHGHLGDSSEDDDDPPEDNQDSSKDDNYLLEDGDDSPKYEGNNRSAYEEDDDVEYDSINSDSD